jgi:hypothetical protein
MHHLVDAQMPQRPVHKALLQAQQTFTGHLLRYRVSCTHTALIQIMG